MTAQERLQQYAQASPKNTIAVTPQQENALRAQRADAHSQNQVRMIDTARRNQQAEREQIIDAQKRRTQRTDRR